MFIPLAVTVSDGSIIFRNTRLVTAMSQRRLMMEATVAIIILLWWIYRTIPNLVVDLAARR